MINRNSCFKKEVRQAYLDNAIGIRRKMILALFVGLVSFAVYFILQTLKQSVLSDVVPEIMQPSFFSTLYIYIHAALLFITVYFMVYYDALFFSEIRRNAWYLLIQMRYRPIRMIAGKLTALVYSTFLIYTVGFAVTLLLTIFLKYSLVVSYLPALYVSGIADIVLLTALSAVLSLQAKRAEDARLFIFAAAFFILLLKAVTGAYGIVSNRVVMQDLGNLFDVSRSWYFPITIAVFCGCVAVAVLRAQRLARYYNLCRRDEERLPPGVTIVTIDPKTGKPRQNKNSAQYERRRKLLNTAVTALLVVLLFAALSLNVLIILIGTATPGNEVTIRGMIPYVFASDTMQPSIMVNDLVFFRKIDVQYPIEEGQIVLFKDNNIVYVERVTKKLADTLEVDIDHYPPAAEIGAMIKQLPRSAIYGVYSGRSRWLGALILFANTIIGRMLFLLIPAVLLFFRKHIAALFKRYRA